MSSSSSRHQTGSSLSCDVSSSSGPPSQSSPSLPSKVYDCSGRVVLLQEMLQAGVTEIRGGDGRLAYCFFQVLQTSQYLDGSSVRVYVSDEGLCCHVQLLAPCGHAGAV